VVNPNASDFENMTHPVAIAEARSSSLSQSYSGGPDVSDCNGCPKADKLGGGNPPTDGTNYRFVRDEVKQAIPTGRGVVSPAFGSKSK
jgi:hypothetical protein